MADTKRDQPAATFQHSNAAAEWKASTDRVPVFDVVKKVELDGEGNGDLMPEVTTYTMPAKPNAGLGLAYLKQARRLGPDVAASWLIEEAVGEDGYDALTEELAGLDEGQDSTLILQSIVTKIQTIALGGLEAPKA